MFQKPCTHAVDIRLRLQDHFIAQEYYLDNPQKLTSEILAAYSATIPTDDNGR